MLFRFFIFSQCILLLHKSSFSQRPEGLPCILEEISLNLDITITTMPSVCDSWSEVHYNEETDELKIIRYLQMLLAEYSKYPPDFLRKVNIETIVLTKDLSFKGQPRAAVPDPYKKQLFLSVNGAYGTGSSRYLVHVMHHELHHCTEFTLWKSMTFDWNEWLILNEHDFCYGNGGASAYDDHHKKGTDVYSPHNPRKGFINLYSLTGDEEDRAEVMAYLMSDVEKPILRKLCQKDEILQKKASKLINLLRDFTQDEFVLPDILSD